MSASIDDLISRDDEIVTEVLDRWAASHPEKLFLYDGERDTRWTYGEFARTTDSLASRLIDAGITKGDRVSLLVEDPAIAAVWMFGIWKAGGVYCPINTMYFGDLLTYQIDDTDPKMLVTEESLARAIVDVKDQLASSFVTVLHDAASWPKARNTAVPQELASLEALDGGRFLEQAEPRNLKVHYADTANIIYTSGTTGRSKGVVESYRWMYQYAYYPSHILTEDDVVYSDLPMFHVGAAFFNVARAVWAGAAVALWRKFSSSQFWDRIDQSGATAATLVGVMVPWLMASDPRDEDRRNSLNKVHMQPLPGNHRDVASRFGFDFVTTGFGQTEAGLAMFGLLEECAQGEGTPHELYVGRTHAEMASTLERLGAPVFSGAGITQTGFMGRPTSFFDARVHDVEDEECAVGEIGQLVLRPRAPSLLADGYLGKADATMESWRNLWFHTGDAVYVDEDGLWYFVDRMGDRIRRRGENVSTQHLEDLVSGCPGVGDAVAVPYPSADAAEDDIGLCVTGAESLTSVEVFQWCEQNLPRFMRPQRVVVVPEVPTTPTGKIQRFKLRNMFHDGR
ncbi:AMP-binding protein [Cumulibacter soli]|uniref:AMP-binding protein n=1 Tax=Cumulibacter soli TaxID=2546344 RepID=UPI001419D829|nr:AMP-binding protein [Cumulibacter soli]